jgi:hypothetical protein
VPHVPADRIAFTVEAPLDGGWSATVFLGKDGSPTLSLQHGRETFNIHARTLLAGCGQGSGEERHT